MILVVAAHPDDETLGASALLGAAADRAVLHLTDGAPRDPAFRPAGAAPTRAGYAAQRRDEARRALALAGVTPDRIHALDFVDQELCLDLEAAAHALADWFARLAPDLVVTHAYEGGHPDHDAAAFAVAAACTLRRRGGAPPRVIEMALYHGAAGPMRTGEFLPGGPATVEHRLSATEHARRRAMLTCFATQHETLRPFLAADTERRRAAPRYDFAQPPHPGPLLYEHWGFALTGARWRALAAAAAARLARC